MKKIILILAIASCINLNADAQATSSANQNTALSLSDAISITFTASGNGTGNSVSMPFNTVSDFSNGVISSSQTLKVQSNKTFNITVNTTSWVLTYSGSSSSVPTMWVFNVLGIQVAANNTGGSVASGFNNTYGALWPISQTLLSGCTNGGNQTFDIRYKANPGFSFPAGTYSANIVYTASQP